MEERRDDVLGWTRIVRLFREMGRNMLALQEKMRMGIYERQQEREGFSRRKEFDQAGEVNRA